MRRCLEPHEIAYARDIFGDAIDYDAVRITRGSLFAIFSATAVGNEINLRAPHFAGDGPGLSAIGMSVLIHELAHVWQYQNSGYGYIASSLMAQLRAWATTGSRRAAYDWRNVRDKPWPHWNAEQQAQCISDYSDALRRTNDGQPNTNDAETLAAAGRILGRQLFQPSPDAVGGTRDVAGEIGMRDVGKIRLQ